MSTSNSRGGIQPRPRRLRLPESYGVPRGRSAAAQPLWSRVSERLTSARTYWVGTTRPDGRPHTAPVWGVWMDEAFTFATARDSRKGRNLAANPALVVHLDSGEAVVILEGLAKEVTDPSLLAQFADAYEAKYRWRPDTARAEQVVYALRPRAAFTWQESDFPESGVRWRFDGA